MNKKLFEIEMIKSGDTQDSLSTKMNIVTGTINKKLNGKSLPGFSQREIKWLTDYWKLTPEQVFNIFFTKELS